MARIAHVRKTAEDSISQSLEEHLIQVAAIAAKNAEKIGLSKAAELLGLLHDLGKYSESFQSYIGSATGMIDQDADEYVESGTLKGKIDHSTAGAQYLLESSFMTHPQGKISAQFLSACIVSHHSGLIDLLQTDGFDSYSKRMHKEINKTHLSEIKQNLDIRIKSRIDELLMDKNIPDSIVALLQRIAKVNDSEKSMTAKFQFGLAIRMLFSCLIDADRLDTADFEHPVIARGRQHGKYTDWQTLINRLESHLDQLRQEPNKNPIDNIRSAISDACYKRSVSGTGIFTLTVPTGGGKTLASLRFALHHAYKHKLDRIVYVIPFTSIIDQNAEVARNILEREEDSGNVVLEHHSNLLPELQNWKNKILSENWDAPVVFTTSVQFLETMFGGGTRGARRLHQLANAVVIFDEIQALPVKTVHMFNNAINYLTDQCHTSIILCSATQPLLNKVDEQKGRIRFDDSNEIMPQVSALFKELKRVDVIDHTKPAGWRIEEIANFASAQAGKCNSCLVVVNTKKNASLLFKACSSVESMPVYHLSTGMCPAHRMDKMREIRGKLGRQEPFVCISTQLIEAGVDIDFGTVIRFVAGMDSIIQAAGRCNRHGKRSMGQVYIVNPDEENLDSLQDIKAGKIASERLLQEIKTKTSGLVEEIIHPEIIERFYQYYFHERASEMVYKVDIGRDDSLLELLSLNRKTVGIYKDMNNNKEPYPYFRQSFKTAGQAFKAIDAPTSGIVVPYTAQGEEVISELFSAFAVEKQFALLKKAQRYTVNVFPNELKKLMDAGAIKETPEIGVLTLADPRYYHPDFGLQHSITKEYDTLIC